MIIAGLYTTSFLFVVFYVQGALPKIWFSLVFVYSAVTYLVYVLDPQQFGLLNISLSGDHAFEYGTFLILSFTSNFMVFEVLKRNNALSTVGVFAKTHSRSSLVPFALFILLIMGLWIYFWSNQSQFQWGRGSNSLGTPLFAILFRLAIPLAILFLGNALLDPKSLKRSARLVLVFIAIAFLTSVAIKSGSRSDIVYFAIGILLYTVSARKPTIWEVVSFSLLVLPAVVFASQLLVVLRESGDVGIANAFRVIPNVVWRLTDANNWLDIAIGQDYFAPSSTLAMSVEKGIVVPIQALESNVFNILYFFGGPTLSTIVVGQFDLSFLRGAGFAYFIYAEGYNTFGYWGFLYNGIIWGILLYLLDLRYLPLLARERAVLLGVLGYFILQLIRNQSGISIKIAWSQIIPVLAVGFYVFGYSVSPRNLKKTNR